MQGSVNPLDFSKLSHADQQLRQMKQPFGCSGQAATSAASAGATSAARPAASAPAASALSASACGTGVGTCAACT